MEGQIRRLSEKSEYEVRILDGGRCVDYCVMGDLAEAAEWGVCEAVGDGYGRGADYFYGNEMSLHHFKIKHSLQTVMLYFTLITDARAHLRKLKMSIDFAQTL